MAIWKDFYYKPRIDKELLAQYSGGLIALSACLKGAVPQKLLMEQPDAALAEAMELQDIFGKGNFYLELQDHGLPAQRRINPAIIEMAQKTGIPLVCTNDSHYLRREDSVAHDVLLCIGTGKVVAQPDRMRYESGPVLFQIPRGNASALGPNSRSDAEHRPHCGTLRSADRNHATPAAL